MGKGTKTLGQVAYEAWRKSRVETLSDNDLAEWDELHEDDQAAMHGAATAVREAVITNIDPQSFRDHAYEHLPQSVFKQSLADKIQAEIDAGRLKWGPVPETTAMTTNPAP